MKGNVKLSRSKEKFVSLHAIQLWNAFWTAYEELSMIVLPHPCTGWIEVSQEMLELLQQQQVKILEELPSCKSEPGKHGSSKITNK